jgi:hypothetical protein
MDEQIGWLEGLVAGRIQRPFSILRRIVKSRPTGKFAGTAPATENSPSRNTKPAVEGGPVSGKAGEARV